MEHRINRKLFSIYALDIETHNDEESIKNNTSSMWLGCFINEKNKLDDEESYFYNFDELLERLKYLSSSHRKRINGKLGKRNIKNLAIYIYNLSFEYSFLLPYLIKWGFKFKENITKEDEYVFNSITTKSVSSVWEVNFKFNKTSGIIKLRDMAKMYSGGLSNVAKNFHLETQKGEIDYTKNRLHNYTITKEEKEYCFKDTRIIIEILLKILEENDKDFFNSISMASYSMRQLLKSAYPHSKRPYLEFRKEYPILSEEESNFVRNGFAGGLCYAVERYQFKEVKNILHIDAKQMYPSMIYLHSHPFGEGTYFKGKPAISFKTASMCHIKISYTNAKLHSVIQLIGIPFIEDKELYVWDFEIPTMYKIYENLEIKYIDGYTYKTKFVRWRSYIRNNFLMREQAKIKNDLYNVQRYKLLNNSGAYGKFLERPHNIIIKNTINDLGIIDSVVEDKKLEDIKINAKFTYTPLCSITAWARVTLIETALKFGIDSILYFDTDSIFCIRNEFTEKVFNNEINLKNELGGWSLEEDIIERGTFLASKRYKLETRGHLIAKAGGINFDKFKMDNYTDIYNSLIKEGLSSKEAIRNIEIPYDELNLTNCTYEVQRAYRCIGGTLIKFQAKEVGVQKKYLSIYKNNVE